MTTDERHNHGAGDYRYANSGRQRGETLDQQDLTIELRCAARDGCAPCRQSLLDRIAEDASTTTELTLRMCTEVCETFGNIARELLEDPNTAFQQLVKAFTRCDLGEEFTHMYQACLPMDSTTRRSAASRALDVWLALSSRDPALFGSVIGLYECDSNCSDQTYTVEIIDTSETLFTSSGSVMIIQPSPGPGHAHPHD